MKSVIHYINTDLELVASGDLTALAAALSSADLFELHVHRHTDGLWYAGFETNEQFDEPDQNIATFLTAIESLNTEYYSIWSSCTVRVFDIGYACGDEPFGFQSHLTAATLERAAAVRASLRLTLYPPDRSSQTPHDTATNVA